MSEAQSLVEMTFELNGAPVAATVEPQTPLIDLLRERFGLTGTKRSCDVQVCGACTVLLDGAPVSSCTVPAFEARGREVLTVEGFAAGEDASPLIEAFVNNAAFQCGFCTPGMLLAAKSLLDADPAPSEETIKDYMRGNVCRCTGYKKIVEAVHEAAEASR
ncbi:MAG: (2Fe-2S)-binding protein [Chloroflexota bacterium]|nr:(2Fe-2S)-binding protein [Chloroflexota bacterium]MDE2885548.1 (2Fe-2S)-binding protein [Chloroflexota bacterium]